MNARLSKIMARSQYVLFVVGISLLGYCVFVWISARSFQAQARQQLLRADARLTAATSQSRYMPSTTRAPMRVSDGLAVLGRLDAPQIQLSAVVAEGADSKALRLAIGHVPGTALPGQPGNVALVAHRDTFFRRLGELKVGDVIRLTVPGRQYRYRVTFTDIVNPKETWVLQPATGDTLTLVTCYPFHFIGAAPQRFVVRARRLDLAPLTREGL